MGDHVNGFPPEKDLEEGDTAALMVWGADAPAEQAPVVIRRIRQEYQRIAGGPCDIVMLAVPAGKGGDFVQGMEEAFGD